MKWPKKGLLNFFLVSYLIVIIFAGLPASNTFESKIKAQAKEVAFALGIWANWSMFAPNPIKFDSKTYVEVIYKNGAIVEYDVEEKPSGVFETINKARWMKYAQDNLRNPNQRALLLPALRYFKQKYD